MTYTILQVITNNYDMIHDNADFQANKALLFTDSLNSNIKNFTQVEIPTNTDWPFDDVFRVRWNPFDYSDTDYCVWLDGSIQIKASIKHYVEEFAASGCDLAIVKHPSRDNVFDEYKEWVKRRNYSKEKAFKWLNYMTERGLDIKHCPLYQPGIMFFKNNKNVKKMALKVYDTLHKFNNGHVERLDQTVLSFLLATEFKDLKIFELKDSIYYENKELSIHWAHPNR